MIRILPLLLIALTAVAADPAAELEHGRALQLAHEPREAIAVYAALIDERRFAVEHTAPALVGLVECFQMLAGDAGAAADYARIAAKYLAKPPALDGKATLAIAAARKDLLWKPWVDGAASPFAFAITGARRSIENENGKKIRRMQVTLSAEVGDLRVQDAFGFAQAFDQAFDQKSNARLRAAGKAYAGRARTHAFDGKLTVTITVDGVPAKVEALDAIEATVPLTVIVGRTLAEKPLRVGEHWTADDVRHEIASFTSDAGGHHLEIVTRLTGDAGGGAFGVAGAASATASAGGGGAGVGDDSPIWLRTATGGIHPNGSSSTSSNGQGRLSLDFPAGDAPTALMVCTGTETATGDVRIALTDVPLP
ncbi:MAG TPA: hypothetical protein VEL07_00705 [Planctomycetota bacterium]|nr:hypothetical protein [Planctomycetota bacterium]